MWSTQGAGDGAIPARDFLCSESQLSRGILGNPACLACLQAPSGSAVAGTPDTKSPRNKILGRKCVLGVAGLDELFRQNKRPPPGWPLRVTLEEDTCANRV